MESLIPMGGFQLPFQRRLSRLYNDTKKSTDFVKEPTDGDPDITALHRKLRIQKDRLVSWGLEWSDPTQSAEIDESLSKAGLSEVVGSIMSTIKDILAEAEPLWQSTKHVVDNRAEKKGPLVQWDKGRFEDLIRDLTASIDTLYDLSRTRASGYLPRRMSKAAYKSDEFRPFESSRMQTPQQINPATLTHLRPKEDAPPREVVFMSKIAYSDLNQGAVKEPWAPLLLEYAGFDAIYSTTGIMPPMARFEKLYAGLQQDPQRAPGTWTGLPRLLGYFEDLDNSRMGLVFRFPPSFNALSFERLTKNPSYSLPTLNDLLGRDEPPLEAKFRLAYNLTNTVFDMHARGVTHGSLTDRNISFSDAEEAVDVRRPLVSSFDLFPADEFEQSRWRHPLDPRGSTSSPVSTSTDERVLELYSLSMMLLCIGMWSKIDDFEVDPSNSAISDQALSKLAVKCGTLYMKAVQGCWQAVEEEMSGQRSGEQLLITVQMQTSRFLESCCILDGVSGLEERIDHDLREDPVADLAKGKSDFGKMPMASKAKEVVGIPSTDAGMTDVRPKMRLYPHVPLSPDIVDKWNTILMPQINQALRHFYRKHAESVEVSLESIGPDSQSTQPTVLVVCTSVGKVRAILKKRLGELFDGTTGFALKVCRGNVLRSKARRSMADDEVAVNPDYQARPANGASIGAWIGDRHLPPVSFGGLVLVDNKPYGMTVHHMLDDPDADVALDNYRSSAAPERDWYAEMLGDSDDAYELSDDESDTYSETDITSDYGDDYDDYDDFQDEFEAGDIPGIEPGCGDGYVVTQPALDDVEEGFYPCAETQDEDHLDSFTLGEVYASSGIRRRQAHGLIHEVDWALFEFADRRLPDDNVVPRVSGPELRPTTVAPSSSLPGLEVQCMARTSGLQTGQILPTLTSVKIYGRTSPSHAYQVTSLPSESTSSLPMGIPGDSGAWIMDTRGQVCGHVLAWSSRKRVAYICPMDVLLLDVAQSLEANEVRFPGGEAVISLQEAKVEHPASVSVSPSLSGRGSSPLRGLASSLEDLSLRRIGVTG